MNEELEQGVDRDPTEVETFRPIEMTEAHIAADHESSVAVNWLNDGTKVGFDLANAKREYFIDATKTVEAGEIITLGESRRRALHRRLDSCINAIVNGGEVQNG